MDPTAVAGMIFTLVAMGMVGGFVLLFPISRRLGKYLENRLELRESDPALQAQLRRMESRLEDLQKNVEELTERQSFSESLLSSREPLLLGDRRPEP